MSDKFDMKLVIDAVTTPLLHARLSQSNSYRERAALLRSLAESALREDKASAVRAVDRLAASRHDFPSAYRSQPAEITRDVQKPAIGNSEGRGTSEANAINAHDVDQIADAFGSFL